MKGYKKGTRFIWFKCERCKTDFQRFISTNPRFCSIRCGRLAGVIGHFKKHTEESKEKMRRNVNKNSLETTFKIGHKVLPGSEKTRFKRGMKPWNWQGGKRTLSSILKDDVRYKRWRLAVFRRDNFTCQNCWKRGCYLEPHHKKAKALFPELAFDIDNGITLCRDCHKLTDNYAGKTKRAKSLSSEK